MITVSILPVPSDEGPPTYFAVAGLRQSTGLTAGEALDALVTQLPLDEASTLVIVQHQRADRFLSTEQRCRLRELMDRWRSARDTGSRLPDDDQQDLEALVESELRAATMRASAIADGLGT